MLMKVVVISFFFFNELLCNIILYYETAVYNEVCEKVVEITCMLMFSCLFLLLILIFLILRAWITG